MELHQGPGLTLRLRKDHPSATASVWSEARCPVVGPALAIDTETLPIANKRDVPNLVLLQVCNGTHVDLVPYGLAAHYLDKLCGMNATSKIFMFNAAFDLHVLNHKALFFALTEGRLVDVGIRYTLSSLEQRGWAPERLSLAQLVRYVFRVELAKDDDVRLTYHHDMDLTKEHMRYAAMDALATWSLADSIPEMILEDDQTRAAVALSFIERNGLRVDRDMFDSVSRRILAEKAAAETKLLDLGFPLKEDEGVYDGMVEEVLRFLGVEEDEETGEHVKVRRMCLQRLLAYCVTCMGVSQPHDLSLIEIQTVWGIVNTDDGYIGPPIDPPNNTIKRRKQQMDLMVSEMCRMLGAPELRSALRFEPFFRLLWSLLTAIRACKNHTVIMEELRQEYEDNGGWPKLRGPSAKVFLQEHLTMLEQKLELQFPTTKKSGEKKISKDDMWRLKEKGYDDPLLASYLTFKHAEKMLSTYLKAELICFDGRVHPRFDVIKRTYRTGCSSPNIQNVPNSDGMRGVFVASEGCALLTIDYSQVELCSLAQECLDRFGSSRLGLMINLGIDVHAWLAGRMLGIINGSNDLPPQPEKEDIARVREICAKLKSSSERKWAKAGNFGFPGGMMPPRFLESVRARGILDMDLKVATELRKCWLASFPEMEQYLHPTQIAVFRPDAAFPEDIRAYEAHNRLGQRRRNCTANAANNFPFQSLAAAGAKRAMWELSVAGLPVVNFVHDEFMFDVPVSLLVAVEKQASQIMIAGMRSVIPDIHIGVESAAMLRWNKDAKEVRDSKGGIAIWVPETATESTQE